MAKKAASQKHSGKKSEALKALPPRQYRNGAIHFKKPPTLPICGQGYSRHRFYTGEILEERRARQIYWNLLNTDSGRANRHAFSERGEAKYVSAEAMSLWESHKPFWCCLADTETLQKNAKARATKASVASFVRKHPSRAPKHTTTSKALSVSERAKIKKLLRTKTLEGVTLGIALLESTAATPADWAAIFTPQICTSLLNTWVPEIWELVAKSLESYCELSTWFQTLALERYRKRPRNHADFDGLVLARKGVCHPAFVKRWSAAKRPRAFMEFILIPAGSFTMGSPEKEEGRGNDEKQVPVTITRAFELGKTVVTQKQWTEVMGTDPWNWKGGPAARERHTTQNLKETGDNYPAVCVSWLEASLFCEHLTSYEREAGRLSEKQTYRLPTEAEWEYACRAGTTTAYSCGDDESSLKKYAWYDKNSSFKLHKVSTKKPNPWGLFDMHGNVWEWCGSRHLLRGGSWSRHASDCRSGRRASESYRSDDGGFRIVLSPLSSEL